MYYKTFIMSLLMTSFSVRAIGEDAGKRTLEQFEKRAPVIGLGLGSGFFAGASILKWGCRRISRMLTPSPEEKAKQATEVVEDCFKAHIDSPVNDFGFPSPCTQQVLALLHARESVDNPKEIKKASDIIKAYKELRDL